jgi:hypothetical protein
VFFTTNLLPLRLLPQRQPVVVSHIFPPGVFVVGIDVC